MWYGEVVGETRVLTAARIQKERFINAQRAAHTRNVNKVAGCPFDCACSLEAPEHPLSRKWIQQKVGSTALITANSLHRLWQLSHSHAIITQADSQCRTRLQKGPTSTLSQDSRCHNKPRNTELPRVQGQ